MSRRMKMGGLRDLVHKEKGWSQGALAEGEWLEVKITGAGSRRSEGTRPEAFWGWWEWWPG